MSKVDWWDRSLAISGMIVALAALGLSITETRRNERFARMQAMPLLTVDGSRSNGEFTLSVTNRGGGPALVKWMKVTLDDEVMDNWDSYYELLGLKFGGNVSFGMLWPGSTIAANDGEIRLLREGTTEKSRKLWSFRGHTNVHICYCSIYDDCQIASNFRKVDLQFNCEATEQYRAFFRIPPSFEVKDGG